MCKNAHSSGIGIKIYQSGKHFCKTVNTKIPAGKWVPFVDGRHFPLCAQRKAPNVWSGSVSAACSYCRSTKPPHFLSRRADLVEWSSLARVYSFSARVYKIIVAFAAVKKVLLFYDLTSTSFGYF